MKIDLEMFLARIEVAFPVIGRSSQIILPHPCLPAFSLPEETTKEQKEDKRTATKGRTQRTGLKRQKFQAECLKWTSPHFGLRSSERSHAWQSVAWWCS